MLDISRDPRWGRIAEGPGEDPYLGSCMARAYVQGFQGSELSDSTTLMACVKHFALYGAPEAGRDYNTVDMSSLRMFNEYLPPYKAGVEAGAGSVMTAFNEVNGIPGSQQLLLKALLGTGKPVVLVLFTGRPLTLEWEQENIPAILNVWFGGTQSGNAVADVIFGDANPCGKLPVTFPRNVGQIPIYYSHKPTGRPLPEGEWYREYRSNYLDVPNEPLYPFGFGLSYTQFGYGDLKTSWEGKQVFSRQSPVPKSEASSGAVVSQKAPALGAELEVTFTLKNTGVYDGAEVVQLYIRDLVGSVTRPVKELKGFQKVFLEAGESKEVRFTITTEDLKFYNANLDYDWEPGEFVIMVGGNSRDVVADTLYWER